MYGKNNDQQNKKDKQHKLKAQRLDEAMKTKIKY